ncbi:MAG TPA: nitric-oxide reductase large subunit [Planctomycetota bacterium]|nr:nitric-oxide reductase large subunit [Planctomycetota bacterium]
MQYTRLWVAFGVVIVGAFATLGYFGYDIYRQAPPVPERVVCSDGRVLFTGQEIKDGQNVWQSTGGQQLGTVWGHGAYVAPDWSADWLHRESMSLLDRWAGSEHGKPFDQLSEEQQVAQKVRLQKELRPNTYDAAAGTLTVSPARAEAMTKVAAHYSSLFMGGKDTAALREAYAMPAGTIKDQARMEKLTAFFFWTSWACTTNRPGRDVTYTQNWPHEELVGNRPTSSVVIWSIASVIMLLAGVGALVWYSAAQRKKKEADEAAHVVPGADPLRLLNLTPSMRATLKYFWVVGALLVVQVLLGALTAHYGVEGLSFFGFPISKWLPYAVTRTWHTQLGIFWIATAWLATGLYLAPAVSGVEPKYQRLGVNVLFVCLLIIVVGSMAGQWFSIQQRLGLEMGFWFGHQGYEYVDLGRFWQIFLFAGLFIWLGLMVRGMWPAFKRPGQHKHLLALFMIACAAIGLFYGAGLMWGRQTNLAIAEYWRWWVVHLWVEGFFEVFATAAIAFLFTRMGLLNLRSATTSVLFSTSIFLSGGIVGTLHHLYFTGTSTAVMAMGSVFSALEIVPLVLIGFEAYENLWRVRAAPWVRTYRWPIYFFVAVAFWNFVGAGLFGFLINTPIALYYVQGLNLTPLHGHTALFGVYGMLGIGFLLFCLKGLYAKREWSERPLTIAFWSLNGGLMAMALLSLLPLGLIQASASIDTGMWYARSVDLLRSPLVQNLKWLRAIGDVSFAFGCVTLVWFMIGLKTGWSLKRGQPVELPALARAAGE